ncbi:MAG: RHS repeat-associated core domain-containing protein, partial [Myxococcota bacterium]
MSLRTLTMRYDDLNRLEEVVDPEGAGRSLSFDAMGNVQWQSGVGTYDYTGRSFSPSSINGVSQTYDANGNLILAENGPDDPNSRRITYAPQDRPRQVSKGGQSVEFEYGPNNEAVIEIAGDRQKVRFGTWELDTLISAGGSLDGSEQTLSVSMNGVRVQRRLVASGQGTTPSWDAQWHYLVRDIVGSLVASTDTNGALEFQQEYDPFGSLVWRTDSSGQTSLGSGFTGHHDLAAQGLVSMKARLYDPELARFINADPVMQAPLYSQSSNRYAYVFNNPLKYVDPTGMVADDPDARKNKRPDGGGSTTWTPDGGFATTIRGVRGPQPNVGTTPILPAPNVGPSAAGGGVTFTEPDLPEIDEGGYGTNLESMHETKIVDENGISYRADVYVFTIDSTFYFPIIGQAALFVVRQYSPSARVRNVISAILIIR